MSLFGRAVGMSPGLLRVALAAVMLLVGWIALADRSALAQADPCSLITTEEVEAVTGAVGVEANSSDALCQWHGTTPGGDFLDVRLMPDVIDAEQFISSFTPYDEIEVAGFPAFRFAETGITMIAVQLPTSAPWLALDTFVDMDASTAAIGLLEIAIERIGPTTPSPGPPSSSPGRPSPTPAPEPPTRAPATPTPTPAPPEPTPTPVPPTPTPVPEPTPFADAGECLRAIEAADLADDSAIDVVAACRFTQGGLDAAREALAAGGTRDQLWAAVWLYATSGTEPAPLLPMLAADDSSIRAMAAAALLRLGERDALEVLRVAVTDQGVLLGSLPPMTISAYGQSILARFVIADIALASPGTEPDPVAAGQAWRAWLDDHADELVYDAATGEWGLP